MAKIIQLDEYRKSGVLCEPLGVVFPQPHRLTGAFWKDSPEGLVADPDSQWTEYTLASDDDGHLANAKFEPISHLSRDLDAGWVIVRHHFSEPHVDGYISACLDLEEEMGGRVTFRTDRGLFTIIHRAARKGCPDHLLIYAATIPHPMMGTAEWTKVLDADGNELPDSVTYPDEDANG
jgi:hypothetical protein